LELNRLPIVSALILAALTIVLPAPSCRAQAPTSAQLQNYSGEYTDLTEPDTPYDVYVDNGKLTVESERMVPARLDSQSATEFKLEGSKMTINFTLDGNGRATELTDSADEGAVFKRTGEPVRHIFHDYVATDVMIPMRDGIKLHAIVLKPSDISAPLPIIIERTPYGVDGTNRAVIFRSRPELARDGYIFVGEDIRGRFKSGGKFVMMRPLADHQPGSPRTGPSPWGGNNPKAIDESTDTFDTVVWLLKNVSGNNGRVGVVGTSYDGFLSMMAGIDPHPAVKAVSPQAPMIDVWMGDDFFHNGAFRQTYGYDYVKMMESSKENGEVSYGKDATGKPVDGYDYFLSRGSFAQDVKQSGSEMLPTWKLFLKHPEYDDDWRSRGVEYHLDTVAVPTLSVGGYYDQEDMWGPQEEYAMLEPHDTNHENFLVLGPWRHGSWASSSRQLGNVDYGESIGKEFRAGIEAKFFAHYLKDAPGFDLKDTASFELGSKEWKYYSEFPPKDSKPTNLYLEGNGQLGWTAAASPADTSYASDPANPVPYRHRPIQPTYGPGSQWYTWMTEDQRFVTDRKDVAVFTLPVLKQDLTLTGEVMADIFAKTTGTDNDMVVKLIDVYPSDDSDPKMRGYELMTNMEIFRGRYLESFSTPKAIEASAVREYKYSLHDVDHVFKAGHAVMVEIQSTWFPLYDRNPQTFVPNIMKAKPADYRSATITIESGPGHDSSLIVPVMAAH
jgi:hypothetical protein